MTFNFIQIIPGTRDPSVTSTPSDITQNTDLGVFTAVVTWTSPKPGTAFDIGSSKLSYTTVVTILGKEITLSLSQLEDIQRFFFFFYYCFLIIFSSQLQWY